MVIEAPGLRCSGVFQREVALGRCLFVELRTTARFAAAARAAARAAALGHGLQNDFAAGQGASQGSGNAKQAACWTQRKDPPASCGHTSASVTAAGLTPIPSTPF